ncbi:MAG: hypothetical protein N2378_04995, partial [Chloroflexaceae bacterium]|nr:hypothetical protein [Chloroflexaceae bacterium]
MTHHRTTHLACLLFLIIGVAALLLVAPLAAAPGNVRTEPPQTRLPRVSVDDGRLIAGGSSFEVRGVNYTHTSTTPPGCPELHFGADSRCPWEQAAIDADFERMRALGVNTVRVLVS